MHPFDPKDPKAPHGARTPEEEPIEDRPEDRRTLEVRGGAYAIPLEATQEVEPEQPDQRDTMPPPLPVAEYVQTMMLQADSDDDPDAEPPPSRSPISYRGEPPSSSAPLSYRGEPRAPLSWRALRPLDPADDPPPARSARIPPPMPTPASQPEDDEFERRPLSLRKPETTRSPLASLDPDFLFVKEFPRPAPTQPAIPRARITPPPRKVTPAVPSKPTVSFPKRSPSATSTPAITPLPPAPTPKGYGIGPQVRLTPPAISAIPRSTTTRPPNNPADDAEIDALPFDELVEASHRSVPPPTVVAPALPSRSPVTLGSPLARAPIPAGLRLGREPLSSFPPVLPEPEIGEEEGDIPPILDVAWAFAATEDDEDMEVQRDALLPGGIYTAPTALPPSPIPPPRGEGMPPMLEGAWAYPKSSYDEANEITTIGTFDDELELEPVDEIQARFDEGDFAGALLLAERILAQDPSDERARVMADSARERLIEEYLAELGGRRQILKMGMTREEIRWLSLDHRAGFLLSCVDGRMTVEEVLDVSCMPELEALRILCDLRDRGVIAMEVDQARSTRR